MISYRTTDNNWMVIPAFDVEKHIFFDKFKICELCLVRPMCLIFTGDDNDIRTTTFVRKPCEEFTNLAKRMEI